MVGKTEPFSIDFLILALDNVIKQDYNEINYFLIFSFDFVSID